TCRSVRSSGRTESKTRAQRADPIPTFVNPFESKAPPQTQLGANRDPRPVEMRDNPLILSYSLGPSTIAIGATTASIRLHCWAERNVARHGERSSSPLG